MTPAERDQPGGETRRDVVPRHRLVARLNGRFSHRVTTVVAEAGFGKTTALALAVDSNRLDPLGRDVWVRLTPADRAPEQFIRSLASSLELDAGAADESTVDRILDALWSAAPDDVVLILDDAHELIGTEALRTLADLLPRLPTNAHLLVATRRPLDIPLARLRAHGELLELDADDLELDDLELDALRRLRHHDDSDVSLPRHAATADLRLAAGIDAGAEFLWEEILAAYPEDRLMHLRRIAVLDTIDDELVAAVTDGAYDTATLLAGTPLVDRDDHAYRLHAILREALIARLEPGEERKTLAIAADTERHRFRLPRAVDLYHQAGDQIGALETARQFALAPTMLQSSDAVLAVRRIVAKIDPESSVHRVLDATAHFAGLESQVADMFLHAADAAAADRDDDLEALALYRAAQSQLLHHDTGYYATSERIARLAERNEFAAGVHAYLSSISHQFRGDDRAALAMLDGIDALGHPAKVVARAERLYDLARPEQVAVGMTVEDFMSLPPGADAFIGLAMWRRGDSPPEDALRVVEMSVQRSLSQGFTHPTVSTLGAAALIALAAGENELARRFADHAHDLTRSGVGVLIAEVATVARAAVAAVLVGDGAAAEVFASAPPPLWENQMPSAWPTRAQLGSLTLVYVCDPSTRSMLDQVEVGPSLRTAIAAGQAILALRNHDDARPAAELPWSEAGVLRANVLPPHLAELAVAAASLGNIAARELLDQLPAQRQLLQRVATVSGRPAVSMAAELLGEMPRPEPYSLEIKLLGETELLRDGVVANASVLTKRPKVRELLGVLLDRRRLERRDIIDLLWPDHDNDERALASLRTTLSTLNDVLEPGRDRGTAAFHLHIDADSVAIDHRVGHDVATFERLVAAAQLDDRSGLPARALDTYIEAAAVYRGDYLAGLDVPWLVLTRLRLRSLAVNSMCRVSELVAAKGEPEAAARWASDARAIDPLDERAGRLFVAALDAMGNRSAARDAAMELISSVRDNGLDLDPSTARLLRRLGVPLA